MHMWMIILLLCIHSECPTNTDVWNIEWPSTVAGGVSSQPCPDSQGEHFI